MGLGVGSRGREGTGLACEKVRRLTDRRRGGYFVFGCDLYEAFVMPRGVYHFDYMVCFIFFFFVVKRADDGLGKKVPRFCAKP